MEVIFVVQKHISAVYAVFLAAINARSYSNKTRLIEEVESVLSYFECGIEAEWGILE